MSNKTIWTLLLGVALTAVAGNAAANNDVPDLFDNGIDHHGAHGVFGELDLDHAGKDFDAFDFDGNFLTGCAGHSGVGSLIAVNDLHSRAALDLDREQRVDVDEDDVLLAIALANNGANDVSFNKVRDVWQTASRTVTASQTADLDREDVFSALALGVDSHSDELEALACVSDISTRQTATATLDRQVDLEDDTVLLAIAMANAVNDDLEFDEVVNFNEHRTTEIEVDSDVDIDREDAFLALALGAGGS